MCKQFQFFFPGSALFCFFLAAPGKLHHRVSFKIISRHAVLSPHRDPGSFSGTNSTHSILSAARIFALRDRGLRSISPSDAITGFFVRIRKRMPFAPSRIASLTILSSSE